MGCLDRVRAAIVWARSTSAAKRFESTDSGAMDRR